MAQFATYCNYDKGSYRPNAGNIVINIANFNFNPPNAAIMEAQVATSMHEMTHIFGFSAGQFKHFQDEDLNTMDINDVVSADQMGIIAPKTLKAYKEHFDCPTATQVPLENEGAQGSVGSHWERSIMG